MSIFNLSPFIREYIDHLVSQSPKVEKEKSLQLVHAKVLGKFLNSFIHLFIYFFIRWFFVYFIRVDLTW
jgi:hypothetical protein